MLRTKKRNIRQCLREGCGNIFVVKSSSKKKFCSCSCSAKFNNPKRLKANLEVRDKIQELYGKGMSMAEISQKLGYGYNSIVYWMRKFGILRRNLSEAVYQKANPNGDPFKIKEVKNRDDLKLFYTGLGLYLGEGDKKNKYNIKLANTDPYILRIFLEFLREICGVEESKIGAELNIFNDVNLQKSISFWLDNVGIKREQLKTLTIRESRGGSYKNKSEYGTLTIYMTNTKLKKIIMDWCKDLINI